MRNAMSAASVAIPAPATYERGLQTKAGEVRLRVPRLRQQTFETAIIERYRARELGRGGADRDIWPGCRCAGSRTSRRPCGDAGIASTVSELNKKIYGTIEAGVIVRSRASTRMFISMAGLKRSWAGEVRNVSLLVAIGVNESGHREILAFARGRSRSRVAGASISRNAG
jgi:transposase-like protein